MHKRLTLALATGLVMTLIAALLVLHRLPLARLVCNKLVAMQKEVSKKCCSYEDLYGDLQLMCLSDDNGGGCCVPNNVGTPPVPRFFLPPWNHNTFDCTQKDQYISPTLGIERYLTTVIVNDQEVTGTRKFIEKLAEADRLAQEKGVKLLNLDTYRSFKEQIENWCVRGARLFPSVVARSTRIATPGFSKHGSGCAVDVQLVREGRVISFNRRFRHDRDAFARDFEFMRSIMEPAGFENTIKDEPFHWELKECSYN